MAGSKLGAVLEWAKAAGVHAAVVGLSLVLSLVVLMWTDPFPGNAIDAIAFAVLLTHAVAAAAGLLIPRASGPSCLFVFAVAFSSAGCLGLESIRETHHRDHYAAHDRFRDHLASPVPASVSNLRFVTLEEGIIPDLMFRFDADPADLDAILGRLGLERVEPDGLLNPKDFFRYPYYLPVAGGYHLFQGKDKYDEVLTVKTNESHTHAVFRKESSDFYRYRRWELDDPTRIRMNDKALGRLKREYGK